MAESSDLILNVIEKTTGDALKEGARDLDRTADSADNAGKSLRVLGREAGVADHEVVRLKGHIRELSQEFNRTGDTTLLKDIGKDKSQLRQMQNIIKSLTPLGEEGGKAFNKGFLSSLGELGSNLRGSMIPVAIGIGALMSPIIGAAVAGAVVGVAGLGGIAGGIAAAAQDPRVKSAASVFGSEIAREFAMTGHAFVQPVIDALQILEAGFRSLDLGSTFAKVAPVVDDLARGIVGLAQGAMPGLNRALDQAGPAIELLASELPQVGAAFGDMIGDISESDGAIQGLHFVLELLEGTMRVTGTTVAWLSDRFHDMVNINAQLTGAFEDIFAKLAYVSPAFAVLSGKTSEMNNHLEELRGGVDMSREGLEHFSGDLLNVAGSSEKALGAAGQLAQAQDAAALAAKAQADALRDLKQTLDDAFNAQMSLDQATLAIQTDTLALKQAVDEHGTSTATNTEKGLANRRMILGLIQDYERQREASSTSAGATQKATDKFNGQIDALRGLLDKLGFTKDQIDDLLGSYKNLIKQPNINKTITFHIATVGSVPSVLGNVGKIASFDTGGWVDGPTGMPQLAVVHGGEFVVSHDMMRGKTSVPARASAPAAPSRMELVINTSGHAMDDLIGELVRKYVYFRGGDPVAALST